MHVLLYAKLPYIHPQCSAQRAIADDKEMYLRQMPQNGSGGLEEVHHSLFGLKSRDNTDKRTLLWHVWQARRSGLGSIWRGGDGVHDHRDAIIRDTVLFDQPPFDLPRYGNDVLRLGVGPLAVPARRARSPGGLTMLGNDEGSVRAQRRVGGGKCAGK